LRSTDLKNNFLWKNRNFSFIFIKEGLQTDCDKKVAKIFRTIRELKDPEGKIAQRNSFLYDKT